jgi:hypothetical protein
MACEPVMTPIETWPEQAGFAAGAVFALWLIWKLLGGSVLRLLRPAEHNLLHEIAAQLAELRADVRALRAEVGAVKERVSHIEGQLRHLL